MSSVNGEPFCGGVVVAVSKSQNTGTNKTVASSPFFSPFHSFIPFGSTTSQKGQDLYYRNRQQNLRGRFSKESKKISGYEPPCYSSYVPLLEHDSIRLLLLEPFSSPHEIARGSLLLLQSLNARMISSISTQPCPMFGGSLQPFKDQPAQLRLLYYCCT